MAMIPIQHAQLLLMHLRWKGRENVAIKFMKIVARRMQ